MVSADRVPFCFADYCVLDIRRGVPIPGLTGSPSPLIVLATRLIALMLSGDYFLMPPFSLSGRGNSRRES